MRKPPAVLAARTPIDCGVVMKPDVVALASMAVWR
jgi:hypothetical protein